MKWIIILLLLLNGGYFSWQYYATSGDNVGATDEMSANIEHDTLVLLSEVSDERKELLGIIKSEDSEKQDLPSADSEMLQNDKNEMATNSSADRDNTEVGHATTTSGTESLDKNTIEKQPDITVAKENVKQEPVILRHCYSIGPVKNKQTVTRLSKHIGSMGVTVKEVRKVIEKVPSHWIYLSGYKSEAEVKKEISRLSSKGISDTQMIKRSSTNMIISVGLFSTKEGADERLKELQNAGFTPQTSMVTANKTLYYADIVYKDGAKIARDILDSMVKNISGAAVSEAECAK